MSKCQFGRHCKMATDGQDTDDFPFETEQTRSRSQMLERTSHAKYLSFFFLFGLMLLVCTYDSKAGKLSMQLFNISDPRDHRWTYKCVDNKCKRNRLMKQNQSAVSLETCEMLCDRPPLWPMPTGDFYYQKNYSKFFLEQINFQLNDKNIVYLEEACNIFKENINLITRPVYGQQTSDVKNVNIKISVSSPKVDLKLDTDESYHLQIIHVNDNIAILILADNYFGIRHGLETLSQLIWWDEFEEGGGMLKILHNVQIGDTPKFAHRGLMIDTARNYFPLQDLKRAVVGIAANKLNVLHLHLTDSESFPIVLSRVAQLSQYGAYSPDMIYTEDSINELKRFARVRGVRVILEIDAPAHVNSGWEFGPDFGLGDLVICGEKKHNNGHLNPDNPNATKILQQIYANLLSLNGDDEIFHFGGDEVNLNCWANTNASQNYSNMMLFWVKYTNEMLHQLKFANNGSLPENTIIWSSPLTDADYVTQIENYENIIVQYWFGRPLTFLFKNMRVIFSTVGRWYLDCGFGPWKPNEKNGVCDPYTPWQTFYAYRPWKEYSAEHLTVGGEVCLWSEQVDRASLDTRLWPRTAAFAERIWRDPEEVDELDVFARLVRQRERLIARGLDAAAIWPRWCSQNPGKC